MDTLLLSAWGGFLLILVAAFFVTLFPQVPRIVDRVFESNFLVVRDLVGGAFLFASAARLLVNYDQTLWSIPVLYVACFLGQGLWYTEGTPVRPFNTAFFPFLSALPLAVLAIPGSYVTRYVRGVLEENARRKKRRALRE